MFSQYNRGPCCRCGAYLGGSSQEVIERLATFGMKFGVAFQIIDDCLDLMGDQRRLGKSILTDLDKGALSLPIIYLSRELTAKARKDLFAPLRTHATDPAFLRRVAKVAQESGSIAKAQQRASAFLQQARESVRAIPMNGLRTAYACLANYAMLREE